jgi:hypothetical protein
MYGGLVGMRQGLIAPFQVRGAAGSSWSPVDLGAALRLWLKADVGITLNGSDVAAWADQSGNGFNLVQATAAQQPAYNATGFNGRPTVDFVESDTNNLQSAHNVAFSLGTASSWFIVGQMHPETGIYGRLIVYVEATQADTGSSSDYDYFTNVAAILRDNTNNSISGYFSAVQKGIKALSPATNARFGSVWDGTNHTPYVNNAAGTSVAAATLLGASGNIRVGASLGYSLGIQTAAGAAWDGVISEIVVTNTALSEPDLLLLDDYFKAKWGL